MKTKNKIDRREIEIITAHVLKKTREFLVAHPEQHTTFRQQYTINKLIKKRKRGLDVSLFCIKVKKVYTFTVYVLQVLWTLCVYSTGSMSLTVGHYESIRQGARVKPNQVICGEASEVMALSQQTLEFK